MRVEGRVERISPSRVRRVLADASCRVAPQRRGLTAVAAARLAGGARGGRRRAARRAAAAGALGGISPGSGGVRVLAPPRRPAPRTSPVQATRRRLGGATSPTVKLLAAATVAVVATAAASGATSTPQLGGCPVFPATSVWNAPVNTLPVAANSAAIIAAIGDSRCARRLRLGALRRLAHRDPVRRRARQDDAEVTRHVRLRRRERQGPVPDSGERADRGRARAPRLG